MTTPQKPKQPTSRWGWMSQAVASVESGLDRILAEGEEQPKNPPLSPVKSQESAPPSRGSTELNRTDNNARTNDRLQTRLAQAMVKKGSSRSATPAPDAEPASRPGTPIPKQPQSLELDKTGQDTPIADEEARTGNSRSLIETVRIPVVDPTSAPDQKSRKDSVEDARLSKELDTVERNGTSMDVSKSGSEPASRTSLSHAAMDGDAVLPNVQVEHEKSISSLQEEVNGYLEHIDALQRNIQMMTTDAISSAKQIKGSLDTTAQEKQLAERDEKIALLIEEGTKLTKNEMQYRSTIKKLRAQSTTSTKDQEVVRQRAEKAEKSMSVLEARAVKAETEGKKKDEQMVLLSKSAADIDAIARERAALQTTLAEMRTQLSKANKRAEDAEKRAQSDKLEIEQRKIMELQDDLGSANVERQLAEDKLKREIEDLKQSLNREKEQARQMETEMLAEQSALESKLEAFRLRVEEASTGDQGDSQAKSLRQIETLQQQYSAASQNWQGIESTLLARITALERERDEVVNRETDLRRKLRDATTKAKSASKELDEAQQALHAVQDQEADEKVEMQRTTKRAEQLEHEVSTLRSNLDDQRARAEIEFSRRLEEERARWVTSLPQSFGRMDSPVTSLRKTPGGSMMDMLMTSVDRPTSRRSSTQPFHEASLPRLNSAASVRTNGAIPETPTISLQDDHDDFFANVPATPASGTHADSGGRNVNDVISASTAGAGPSVQLVERLSMNVRRLESEKAASKDELARLSSQRDEARQEVVNLMREVDQKRSAEARLLKLEKDHEQLSAKHQATLELLGEKTEQVDELKADVLDVKQMYRQLADTLGR